MIKLYISKIMIHVWSFSRVCICVSPDFDAVSLENRAS